MSNDTNAMPLSDLAAMARECLETLRGLEKAAHITLSRLPNTEFDSGYHAAIKGTLTLITHTTEKYRKVSL